MGKDKILMIWQRYQLIPFRYIDDQRIMQYDWTRDKPAHTQQKIRVSHTTFPW